jgi:hypothetical protein
VTCDPTRSSDSTINGASEARRKNIGKSSDGKGQDANQIKAIAA